MLKIKDARPIGRGGQNTWYSGEFAETVREQFLEERVEYFKELQRLLYVEALNDDAASKANLVRALCKCDPELGEKQVGPFPLWFAFMPAKNCQNHATQQ